LTAPPSRFNALSMSDHSTPDSSLARLEAVIAQRRSADPKQSYVAKLHARGLPVMARKLGEEATEAVVAALSGDREELISEAADLLFHLLVLLGAREVALAEVLAELDHREGTSGIAEKASRSNSGT
jgi:phosphoribosyl-ATP pyrophosphohydrolase